MLLSALQHNKPLYSFEDNADYVYDVMWSPVHPALFACVDGMGRLDLWNLNNDTEVRAGGGAPPRRGAAPLPAGWGRAGGSGRCAAGEGCAPSAAGTAAAERPASPSAPRGAGGNAAGPRLPALTCFPLQSLQRLP